MNQVQVGIIGAGRFITAYHLLTVARSETMALRAIADLDEAVLARHRERFAVGYTTTDYRKLLADPAIELVVIGTKQDLHAPLIIEALDAGKWVFCEKPLADTAAETEAVLAAEARNPGCLAIGFNRRFAPACVKAKELLATRPRPWLVNYRMMTPNPQKQTPGSYYAARPHIIYEGCHILDFASFLFDEAPARVFMSGTPENNNCVILEYRDGSQFSLMIGALGSYCMWKEYVEFFAADAALTISDFVDLRVRGIPGEFDRLYPTYLDEHTAELEKWGFDFYEEFRSVEMLSRQEELRREFGMELEAVRRPQRCHPFNAGDYRIDNPDLWSYVPDKGWVESLEHFARARRSGQIPRNADGAAGKRAMDLGEALLKARDAGRALPFPIPEP